MKFDCNIYSVYEIDLNTLWRAVLGKILNGMYEDYFVYIYNLNAMLKYVCSLICRRIY